MKTITLKVTKENIGGNDFYFSTFDLLKIAINNPQKGGFDVDEMMKRLRLLEKLDAHKEKFEIGEKAITDEMVGLEATLELEDADFNKMKELFKLAKWNVVSNTIVELSKVFA